MATDALRQDPAFRRLATRVRTRWLLHALRGGVVVGLAAASITTLLGRIAAADSWPVLALGCLALGLAWAAALAIATRPTEWTVARAADGLGLAERITSALYARGADLPVAALLDSDARAALGSLDPDRYAIAGGREAWRSAVAAFVVLGLLLVVPLPSIGNRAGEAAERQSVAVAQQRVQAIEVQVPTEQTRATDLSQRTSEELRGLQDALSRANSSSETAKSLEDSQQRLAHLASSDDYTARRAIDNVASALELSREEALLPLARALRNHDDSQVEQALSDLSSRLDQPGGVSDAERSQIQTALQTAGNAAASNQPRLAGALRRAASALGSRQSGALIDQELRDQLDQDAADAAALGALEQSIADLSQLRATTLPAGATLVPATGTPTAYVLASGTPVPNATLVAVSSSSSAAGSASTGGNPQTGGGPGASPSGSTAYDPVYAPTHLGGDGGQQVQLPGDATGAGGAGVELPNGPLSVGDVRPYDQVYSDYAQAARQAAARQSLPPNVQNLVDRYFGAIAPSTSGSPTP